MSLSLSSRGRRGAVADADCPPAALSPVAPAEHALGCRPANTTVAPVCRGPVLAPRIRGHLGIAHLRVTGLSTSCPLTARQPLCTLRVPGGERPEAI